jgi:hypothetical protein
VEQPVDRKAVDVPDVPIDRLIVQLRAYTQRIPKTKKETSKSEASAASSSKASWRTPRAKPSKWVLVFDCETTITPDQKLRFGAYQLRNNGRLWEAGLFYEPEACSPADLAVLQAETTEQLSNSPNGRFYLRTRADFVEAVFYRRAFDTGAQIVGMNLPFDISRLAIGHKDALRGMKGGFSFELSPTRPNVAVRHRNAKSAFIQFVGTDGRSDDNDAIDSEAAIDLRRNPDRGYFVDLKSLAATLTSQSHSLASLSEALGVEAVKEDSKDHGKPLTRAYVQYGLGDVTSTWQCFEALSGRLVELNLPDVGAYELFSEASLGKAYLRAMNVGPWRKLQPDFPSEQIGQILSSYFGGRAEVRIRRQSVEVLLCDFLSMYPTVCTLMGLWRFVRANGIRAEPFTSEVRKRLADFQLADLKTPEGWADLAVMVQVHPDEDIFPVRAVYREGKAANIGLNYLSADEPMWFTLADVLASKVLTGKVPRIVSAIRYVPLAPPAGTASNRGIRRACRPGRAGFLCQSDQPPSERESQGQRGQGCGGRRGLRRIQPRSTRHQDPRQRHQLRHFRRAKRRGLFRRRSHAGLRPAQRHV